jgi:hypothetical protein
LIAELLVLVPLATGQAPNYSLPVLSFFLNPLIASISVIIKDLIPKKSINFSKICEYAPTSIIDIF